MSKTERNNPFSFLLDDEKTKATQQPIKPKLIERPKNKRGNNNSVINDMVNEVIKSTKSRIARILDKCESPIEKIMALALINQLIFLKPFSIEPQKEITTNNQKYRVDFLVESQFNKVIVECDGHQFHERTKEQAARDKQKDRSLQLQKYVVMRFTGSEIWTDPNKCAKEVYEALFNRR